MSEEENSEIRKSWVFVDPVNGPTSGVEEVETESIEPQQDSDTDSISVISESGCSYKTDDEEFVPATNTETEEISVGQPEIKPPEVAEPPLPQNGGIENLKKFITSAFCAVILIGFSVAIQQYFYGSSDVNKFNTEFEPQDFPPSVSHYVQSVKTQDIQIKTHSKKSYLKRKNQGKFEGPENKLMKVADSDFHDEIGNNVQAANNDLTVQGHRRSNNKANKNKNPATKFHKENYDEINKNEEKRDKLGEENRPNDNTCDKKMKELKMKEDYLKKKEKFLIEKEHDLLKKEIKLNKEKNHGEKSKYDKKKTKKERDSSEYTEMKTKRKEKKYSKDNKKNKGEKMRRDFPHTRHNSMDNEQYKKRNITGQWYINLHKARNNIRQKEHASDWVFDRAHLRSLRRNKAHWYFQWMVDRARLRSK